MKPQWKIVTISLAVSAIVMLLAFAMFFILDQKVDRELARMESRMLIAPCSDLIWNSSYEPKNPSESVEFHNKCIHQYAYYQETKELLEDSDFAYWGSEVLMPGEDNGVSALLFKSSNYPYLSIGGKLIKVDYSDESLDWDKIEEALHADFSN
jgi:hypothetical protein